MGKFLLVVVVAGAAGAQTITEFGAAAATGTAGGAAGKQVSNGITAIFGKVDQQTKAAAKADPAKPETAKPEAVKKEEARTDTSPASASSASPDPGPATKPAGAPAPKAAIKSSTKPAAASISKAAPMPEKRPETANPPSLARTGGRVVPNSVPDPPPPAVSRTAVSKPAPPPAPKPELEVAPILPPPPPPREASAEDLKSIAPGTIREEVLKLGAPASRITMIDDGHLVEIYSYMSRNATLGVVRLSDGAVSRVELR